MRLAHWTALCYLVFIPWTAIFVPELSGHDYARIIEVLTCSICGFTVALRWWRPPEATPLEVKIKSNAYSRHLWLLAIWLLAITSVAHATIGTKALQEMILVLGLITIAFVVASANRADVSYYWQAVILATLFYNCITLILLIAWTLNAHVINIEKFGAGYENIRLFNHVQTVALPLTAGTIHQASFSRLWITAAWIALVTGFILLWLSGGRGTFVGIAAATLISLLCLGRLTWRSARPLIISMMIGYIAYLLLFVQLPSAMGSPSGIGLLQRATDSSAARAYLWELAINYIRESPWFGIGPMHFAHRPNLKGAHPHNVFLQIAAEWGLPMLGLLLLGALAALRQMVQIIRKTSAPHEKCVGGTLFIACVAILIDGLVSGNFVMPVSQVWIAVCIGITANWMHNTLSAKQGFPPATASRHTNHLCAALLGSMMIVQTALLLGDVLSLDELLIRSHELSISDRLRPRFWSEGWF